MVRLRRHVLWVALAAPVMAGLELGLRTLASNDEARFAVLAEDVLARGFRLVPDLNGTPYYNKPVLLAWLIALTSWPFGGVTQLTAVLPSAAAGIATAFAVWALGRDMFGPEAGRYAALVTVATQGFFLQARLPLPDMLMTCFITLAVWQFWRMTRADGGRRHWLGFYGCTAAAFWSKGAAGLLPLAIAFGWALATPGQGAWRRLRLVQGLPLLALLMAPWWLRAASGDGAALREAFVGNQLMWYLPRAPSWKSLTAPFSNGFGILFPWVLVVPIAAVNAVRVARARSDESERVRALLLWSLVALVSIGLSSQQRLRYYLPLVPPAALLIAWWLASAVPRSREAGRLPWRTYAVGAAVGGAIVAGVVAAAGGLPHDASISLPASVVEVLVLAAALGTMVVALLWGVRTRRIAPAFAVAWLGSAVFVAGAYHWEVERFNAAHDFPRVAERMRPAIAAASVVATWGIPELPLAFYTNRRVVAVETNAELDRVMAGGAPAVVLVTERVLAEQRGRKRAPLAVVMSDRLSLRAISLVRWQ